MEKWCQVLPFDCTCRPSGTLEKSLDLGLETGKRKEEGTKKKTGQTTKTAPMSLFVDFSNRLMIEKKTSVFITTFGWKEIKLVY